MKVRTERLLKRARRDKQNAGKQAGVQHVEQVGDQAEEKPAI